jgi:hypothetical protein
MSSPRRRAGEQRGREYPFYISTRFEFLISVDLLIVEVQQDKPPGHDESNQDDYCHFRLDQDDTTAKNAVNMIASIIQYKTGFLLIESVVVISLSS